MRLLNSLYKIKERTDADKVRYVLQLNADHFIYKVHFPEQPITPGVCLVQIGKELLEDYCQIGLDIIKVNNVKFLSVVNPHETPEVIYEILKITTGNEHPETMTVQMVVLSPAVSLAKISFVCRKK